MKKSGIIGGIVIALVLIFGLITAITCLERWCRRRGSYPRMASGLSHQEGNYLFYRS